MTRVLKQLQVAYAPDQMIELVSDIEAYPRFIKPFRALSVDSEHRQDDLWKRRATATVGFKGFSEKFTTDVSIDHGARVIEVGLVDGPFKYLNNKWKFEPSGDGSDIQFLINFEFSNPILHAVLRANFDRAVNMVMDVFLKEAAQRYGARGSAIGHYT